MILWLVGYVAFTVSGVTASSTSAPACGEGTVFGVLGGRGIGRMTPEDGFRLLPDWELGTTSIYGQRKGWPEAGLSGKTTIRFQVSFEDGCLAMMSMTGTGGIDDASSSRFESKCINALGKAKVTEEGKSGEDLTRTLTWRLDDGELDVVMTKDKYLVKRELPAWGFYLSFRSDAFIGRVSRPASGPSLGK